MLQVEKNLPKHIALIMDGEEDRGAGNEDCRDRRSICKAGKCNQFGKAK